MDWVPLLIHDLGYEVGDPSGVQRGSSAKCSQFEPQLLAPCALEKTFVILKQSTRVLLLFYRLHPCLWFCLL